MNPVETYLREMHETHLLGAGMPETSYYGPLAVLLNEVGKTLKPKVRCVFQLQNRGAGSPDGGLFTAEQLRGRPGQSGQEAMPAGLPERGALEVKSAGEDLWQTAQSEQVQRYVQRYGLALLTNYRDFLLLRCDQHGQAVELESFRLADSETDFWAAAAHPRVLATQKGDRLVEYLKRALQQAAPLSTAQDLAWFLASYARDARMRLEAQADLPALQSVRAALEQALGIQFQGPKGEHFFRSTLVQTLYYGLFSAWVLWHEEDPGRRDHFDWRTAGHYLRVPAIGALFDQMAPRSQLRPLGLVEGMKWAEDTLNRVQQAPFFAHFQQGQAVQYFYEPFLEAYDPELRKELGVWYTPTEVIQYMVRRVDAVLRSELGVADGLADPQVYILDPCCGTGGYLLEVLNVIADTLRQRGEDGLLAADLKRAAMERVFGFEILPAPYVIAHLQLGLLLQKLGAPLSEGRDERVGVYLTNSLTGWEPPQGPRQHLMFHELEDERDAAERVKQQAPILVVLGNPPYNAFAGVSPSEEAGLVEPYKAGLISEWGIKKFNLDDLYVRFFRLAERRIAERTGRGVVCYISNFSYLSDPSFVVMRRHLLDGFDALWFDSLNGDSRETGKLTPEGLPDPSIFSTEHNREGIRVGTAIGLLVRKARREAQPTVQYREFWGANKRSTLVESLVPPSGSEQYSVASPGRSNRFSFRPSGEAADYNTWPRLVALCQQPPSNGLMEKRGGALIDVDRPALEQISAYYRRDVDWTALKALGSGLTEDAACFDAQRARSKVLATEGYDASRLRRYALRPLDTRWCYYSPVSPLWNRARPVLWAQSQHRNGFLICRPAAVVDPEGAPMSYTGLLGDNDYQRGHSYYFPILSVQSGAQGSQQDRLFGTAHMSPSGYTPNLSGSAREYLDGLALPEPADDATIADLVWMHALAIGYSPAYLTENADGIRNDWPRIPLPAGTARLLASAALGRQVAALLDTEAPAPGVTAGAIRAELREIGVIRRVDGAQINPDGADLRVTAGWGHGGKDGVTMPGRGRLLERAYRPEECAAMAAGAAALGLTEAQALACLGNTTCDVYLNDAAYWRNVPKQAWQYVIGGYQVMKKWLSYREGDLLGRALTTDEVREVRDMARRIAAILLLQPALDANYRAVTDETYRWTEG